MTDKEFCARLLTTELATECYNRDNKGKNAAHGSYDGTIKQDTLCSVLAAKTTIMYKRLTLIGYLKTILILFKIAFLRKKLNRKPPVFWCFSGE